MKPVVQCDHNGLNQNIGVHDARGLAEHVDGQSLALSIRFLYDWLLSHIRSYDAEMPRSPSG
jgi:hypothetical protein